MLRSWILDLSYFCQIQIAEKTKDEMAEQIEQLRYDNDKLKVALAQRWKFTFNIICVNADYGYGSCFIYSIIRLFCHLIISCAHVKHWCWYATFQILSILMALLYLPDIHNRVNQCSRQLGFHIPFLTWWAKKILF